MWRNPTLPTSHGLILYHNLRCERTVNLLYYVIMFKILLLASLFSDFLNPPTASRPWCYWYWVNGNIDEPTITRDLEAMKHVGFGGLLLLDPRGYDKVVWKPEPKMEFGGDEWRRMVGFAVRECERLGLEFTLNLSDCGGSLKGPWPTGEDGPKRLVCGIDADEPPADYIGYRDIASITVTVPENAAVKPGWRNAGGATGRWEKSEDVETVLTLPEGSAGRKVRLRFGYCLIPKREHDVDVIDADAVARHWDRVTGKLFAELGPLVGKVLTHVYSVSWEGAIPTWTPRLEEQFERLTGHALRPHLPELAGFSPTGKEPREILREYRSVRNRLFKDCFYGTIRRLAHERGVKLYSESGGPWSRDPSIFLEADQVEFSGVNDMPQGEFWTYCPSHHTSLGFNRPAVNAAHVFGLRRASAEAFTHMDLHYSMWPERLKRFADDAFVDGINHIVWHTFSASPEAFGRPGIEYFAGTHLNPNVTWFADAPAFIDYLARCQTMLQAGEPVTDIAIYGGRTPYQHWGRHRDTPWDGSRVAIPHGYNYDILSEATLACKTNYPVFVDGTADTVTWPKMPEPDFEGDCNDVVHRRLPDGTDIYFAAIADPGKRTITFRVRNRIAEIWNPVTGTRRLATEAKITEDGRIKISRNFQKDGSVFFVFRPHSIAAADPAPVHDLPKRKRTVELGDRDWQITIGGRRYDRLGDWTKSDDPEIRYFSGTAIYRKRFDLPAAGQDDRLLSLGRVAGGTARVFVNGTDCGVAWCWPFNVRVPAAALKEGANELEIRVTNTWRNRLIGDCLVPEAERKTRSCLAYESGPRPTKDTGWARRSAGYSANDELEPSGLYGKIELR